MHSGLQLIAALALSGALSLWTVEARAEQATVSEIVATQNGGSRHGGVAACRIAPDTAWYHPNQAGRLVCEWHSALRSAVASVRDDWGYRAGLTLFVVGNVVTFSFPVWAALGADVITITSIVITGEVVEVVGIFLLGEEALNDLRRNLGSITAELRAQVDRLRSTSVPEWSWVPSWSRSQACC